MDEIIVLDYAVGDVWIYTLYSNITDIEDWLSSMGHRIQDCEWMVHRKIEIHDERH